MPKYALHAPLSAGRKRISPRRQVSRKLLIKNLERGATDPRASTLTSIQDALDQAGVMFLEPGDTRDGGVGVRLKRRH